MNHSRAHPIHFEDDAARGRFAEGVWQIPKKGWKDVLWRVKAEIANDRLSLVAAGVAFFLLLALFPGMAALVSLYGLVSDPESLQRQIDTLSGILPADSLGILRSQLERLASQTQSSLSFGFVFGLLFSLWSANNGFKSLFEGLNAVYDEQEKRSFVRLNFTALLFTLASFIGVFVLIGAVVAVPALLGLLQLGGATEWAISLARWPIVLVVVMIGTIALYRWGPSRATARWSWLLWGTLASGVVWLAVCALFSFYLANFGNYNATYGSLGAVIGLMMWIYLSVFVFLVGAELNAEIEHQVVPDTTTGVPQSMGERGARMADTLGEARDRPD